MKPYKLVKTNNAIENNIFKRVYADGQCTYGKVNNIINHKEIKIKAQCDLTQHPPEWPTKHRKYRWPTNT